jgi:hypothetical protein
VDVGSTQLTVENNSGGHWRSAGRVRHNRNLTFDTEGRQINRHRKAVLAGSVGLTTGYDFILLAPSIGDPGPTHQHGYRSVRDWSSIWPEHATGDFGSRARRFRFRSKTSQLNIHGRKLVVRRSVSAWKDGQASASGYQHTTQD